MKLHPEPELLELADGVRKLLTSKSTTAATRERLDDPTGYDRELWETLTQQMGIAGLGRADTADDEKTPFIAQCLVIEQMGYALLSAPYLATVALSLPILAEAGGEEARALADRIEAGRLVAALALADHDSPVWDPTRTTATATRTANGHRLQGVKGYVVDGCAAEVLIVSAQTDEGLSLFAVEAAADGLKIHAQEPLDLTRWLARIVLEDAPATLLGTAGGARPVVGNALDRSGLLLAMEQVGVAQRCLEMSVEYAKVRSQSGRLIGSFQAIKHKCADMLSAAESARAACYFAARAADERPGDFPVAASLAQAAAAEAATFVTAQNIQVHGGIGFTWEHDAHLFYRRAHASSQLLGDATYHRRQLAARLLG
jgi:alkylation response protein AidB-like acyl-CoA dehydrogenase